MLYALGRPTSFVVLLVSFVVGITLHHWVQAVVAARLGNHGMRQERRTRFQPQSHLDPFGAVGALISGLGWGKQVELPGRQRRRDAWFIALSGPLVNVLLGVGLLLGATAVASGGTVGAYSSLLGSVGAAPFLKEGLPTGGDPLGVILLLAGASQLYLGVLSLVPLPPLDGGRLMLALAPRTPGWQKAQYYLVEHNVGTVVLLVLLIFPLGGDLLLPYLLDQLLAPLMSVILGA